MRPTVAEQLAGARRRLTHVAGDPGLAVESRDALTDVDRQLGRLEASWSDRLPFLLADNAATAALLKELEAVLSIDFVGAHSDSVVMRVGNEEDAHTVNIALRESLARVVRALPNTTDGAAARKRIATHLRRRVDADPSRNRHPPNPYADIPMTSDSGPANDALTTTDLTIGADARFAEQFPLTPLDDHMIHQTPDPIRVMWTGDPRVYERYWMVCHDPAGEVLVAVGGSFYPNLNRAEAYAIVNVGGQHTTVRGFRALGADRADLRIGPIAPRIIRGLRWWRFELDPNPWGIGFRIDFRDTTRQVFREPLSNSAAGFPLGRRNDVTTGFESFGEAQGWVDAHGSRIVIPPGSPGTRDRHWGVGRGVGGPALSLGGRLHVGTSGNGFVAFPSWTLWGDRAYYRFGDTRTGAGRVARPNRRLRFEPETRIFLEGVVDYQLDTGATKRVHYERIGQQTAYLRCGMYGGTPDRGIHQGGYDGPDLVEGETFDVNRPDVRASLAGLDEHLCRVTCDGEVATGIYQPIDPAAYDACAAGRPGWAFLD